MMSKHRLLDRLPALLMLVGSIACSPGAEPDAAPADDPAQPGYSAAGNEPFWSLAFGESAIELYRLDVEDTVRVPRPQAERIDGGWRYAGTAGGGPFVVEILERRCNDSMSGRPYPHTVVVTVLDRVYRGCGGDTVSLLADGEWRVMRLDGAPTVDPAPTLHFEADGALSGSGGRNRYRASYEVTGEGIRIGPAAATRIACPEPETNAQEMHFFDVLERVDRFDIAEDGSLVLYAFDEPVIVAAR